MSRGLAGTGSHAIAVGSITGASLSRTFPGGADVVASVKVDFLDATGTADSIYFLPTVGTQGAWMERINAAAGHEAE